MLRIKRDGTAGERGLWVVTGWVAGSGLDGSAYELHHQRSGRHASCTAPGCA